MSRRILLPACLSAFAMAILAVGAPGAVAAEAPGPVKRFALVVGNNAPPNASLKALRYADDDAVRWTILLRTFDTDVELLTDLDAESARLYGEAAPAHHAPRLVELDDAMERLAARMKAARGSGARTVFFFIYAGHGDIDAGEGYVGLGSTRFFRHDLEEHVLGVSPADTNHVIVDACRSLYFAAGRGPGGERLPWPEPYFDNSAAARYPNTGFLLSSSSGGASHEWEEFQGGIFSHELRSGLLGGADADGDGKISYRELAGFVRVANQAIRNEKYRPEILAQPPRSGDTLVLDLDRANAGRIRFGRGPAAHQVLEDSLGIRWADVHPGAAQALTLAMPTAWGNGPTLYLRTSDGDSEYQLARGADVLLSAASAQPRSAVTRGALQDAFSVLFTVPFDSRALDREGPSIIVQPAKMPTPMLSRRAARRISYGTAAGSVAAFAASSLLLRSAAEIRAAAPPAAETTGAELGHINDGISARNDWAIATIITGSILAAISIGLQIYGRSND